MYRHSAIRSAAHDPAKQNSVSLHLDLLLFVMKHRNIPINPHLPRNFRKFELIEPQLSVLARLCVYCIISSLEKTADKSKRQSNGKETIDGERPAKIRKIDDSLLEMLTDGQEKMETVSNGDNETSTTSSSTVRIQEPLKSCLRNFFQTLYKLTYSSELTPKVLFVRQFLIYLHRCGGECITPVLNIIPNGLMKNLLGIASDTAFNYDFILR